MTNIPVVRADAAPMFNLANVRTLRCIAFLIDGAVVVCLWWLMGALMVALAIPTYGGSFALAPLMSLVGVFYSGLTVSGARMSTWGMRAVGLHLTDLSGRRVGFVIAAGHALIFWLATTLSWGVITGAMLGVSLLNAEKRTAHDLLTGVIVSRR